MKYYSTRDKNVSLSAAEAVKMGLSRDGGLLTPTRIPQIDRAFLERLTPLEYARAGGGGHGAVSDGLYRGGAADLWPATPTARSSLTIPLPAPVRKVENDLLPGAVARSHLRVQGHGAADAAAASVRRPAEDRREAGRPAFWRPPPAIPARLPWPALRMCPRPGFWSIYPKDGVSAVQEAADGDAGGGECGRLRGHRQL